MLKEENGFTLIEMLIVLSIITVLIILIVPTLANKSGEVQDTGCDALLKTVQSQASAYHLEKSKPPENIDALVSTGFITKEQKKCRNAKEFEIIHENGNAVVQMK